MISVCRGLEFSALNISKTYLQSMPSLLCAVAEASVLSLKSASDLIKTFLNIWLQKRKKNALSFSIFLRDVSGEIYCGQRIETKASNYMGLLGCCHPNQSAQHQVFGE